MKQVNIYFENPTNISLVDMNRIRHIFQPNHNFDSYDENQRINTFLKETYGLKFSVIRYNGDISVYIKS